MRNCLSCERPASCVLTCVPEAELSEISQSMEPLSYQPGQVIWREGIYRPGYFILCQGDALLTVRKNGETKRRILKFLQAGALIPCLDGAHIGDPSYDVIIQVEATVPVLVRYLPSEFFTSLVARCPSIAVKVIESLSDAVRELLHELWASSYCDVTCKLARALVELQEAKELARQPLSQQFLADLTGVSRSEVNKKLHDLVQEKIIAMQGHKIQILDERRLRALLQLCFIGQLLNSFPFD